MSTVSGKDKGVDSVIGLEGNHMRKIKLNDLERQ